MQPKAKKRMVRAVRMAVLTSFLLTACAAFMGNKAEEPAAYNVVATADDNIEIRQYPAITVAEVTVTGTPKDALEEGYEILAGYINGDNAKGKRIAMTAPVMLQSAGKYSQRVRFVMPRKYSVETLPAPANSSVKLRRLKGAKVAAIRYPGLDMGPTEKRKTDKLRSFVTARGLVQQEAILTARYDPSWTLPFLRRNEVLIVVK